MELYAKQGAIAKQWLRSLVRSFEGWLQSKGRSRSKVAKDGCEGWLRRMVAKCSSDSSKDGCEARCGKVCSFVRYRRGNDRLFGKAAEASKKLVSLSSIELSNYVDKNSCLVLFILQLKRTLLLVSSLFP